MLLVLHAKNATCYRLYMILVLHATGATCQECYMLLVLHATGATCMGSTYFRNEREVNHGMCVCSVCRVCVCGCVCGCVSAEAVRRVIAAITEQTNTGHRS